MGQNATGLKMKQMATLPTAGQVLCTLTEYLLAKPGARIGVVVGHSGCANAALNQ